MILPCVYWHNIAPGVGIISALILVISDIRLITVCWTATRGPQTTASVEFKPGPSALIKAEKCDLLVANTSEEIMLGSGARG
jgi:hypothetical protein